MEQYIIPALSMVIVAIIEAIAASERKQAKKDREAAEAREQADKKRAAEREKAQEELMVLMVQSTRAAIALGEATAHALQRGHTNGDTEAALDYAAKIKHEQKDFLARQGIHALWE